MLSVSEQRGQASGPSVRLLAREGNGGLAPRARPSAARVRCAPPGSAVPRGPGAVRSTSRPPGRVDDARCPGAATARRRVLPLAARRPLPPSTHAPGDVFRGERCPWGHLPPREGRPAGASPPGMTGTDRRTERIRSAYWPADHRAVRSRPGSTPVHPAAPRTGPFPRPGGRGARVRRTVPPMALECMTPTACSTAERPSCRALPCLYRALAQFLPGAWSTRGHGAVKRTSAGPQGRKRSRPLQAPDAPSMAFRPQSAHVPRDGVLS